MKKIFLQHFFITSIYFSLLALAFLSPGLALAVDDNFTIRTLVGSDTEPPTTPEIISAIPVATSQIDITWSVSTDNYLLGGYVLLRDGNAIATTTTTSFIDTGLTPETLYTYEVYAFDHVFNNSTTSLPVATTTLAVLIIPPTPSSTPASNSESTITLRLQDLNIKTTVDNALFVWQTTRSAKFILRWGKNDAYNDGYIMNDIYSRTHKTLISGLEPGSIYYYELIGYDVNGFKVSLKTGQFRTDSRESLIPLNVTGLRAEVLNNDVRLSWNYPGGADDLRVRILRNYLGFPNDTYDGAVVYEGKASTFFDSGALATYERQFYTVFLINADGSIASGAVISVRRNLAGETEFTPVPTAPDLPEIELPDYDFDIKNIVITQADRNFTFKSDIVTLSSSQPFLVKIPYGALPRHLKSIVLTIINPTDHSQSYAFLLRINKERTAYEANIAPLDHIGASRFQIEIFDFEQNIAARYRKPVEFQQEAYLINDVIFPDKIIELSYYLGKYIGPFLFLVFMIWFLWYRRQKKAEDNL